VQTARRAAALTSVLAAEAVGVVLAIRAGSRPPFDLPLDDWEPWTRAESGDALASAVRVVALVAASWLLATTLLYLAASVARLPRLARACGSVTPRGVRRVVDTACAASLVLGALAGPGGADVRDGRAVARPPDTTATPASVAAIALLPAPSTSSSSQTEGFESTVEVAPGDNLWVIAASAIARSTGRDVGAVPDDEIARYWHVVCDRNRDRLHSGDVNLILPGEVVMLPPVADGGTGVS
jgi:hypothetical protein